MLTWETQLCWWRSHGRPGTPGPRQAGVIEFPGVRMNWAESIYINSGLRTKRLRQHVIPKLIALGGRTEGLEVLDIGCGPGECVAGEIEDFGASRVFAVDFDPKMVQRAKGRLAEYGSRATVVKGDVTDLPARMERSTRSSISVLCCITSLTGEMGFKRSPEFSRLGADSSLRITT